jgi:hypothetical protein
VTCLENRACRRTILLVPDAVGHESPAAALFDRRALGCRTCLPGDCGGIWGYAEHEEPLEWLGLNSADQFDPAAFDLAEVNTDLAALATVLVKN